MTRRKPSSWQYSGVARGRKTAARRGRPHVTPARGRSGRPVGRPSRRPFDFGPGLPARLAWWVIYKLATKRWRPLAFSEALIWFGAGAVCIAFLILMAKSSFLLALGIFVLMIVFAWRELGEK